MSYNSIAAAATDNDLRARIAACFAQETPGSPEQPEALASLHMWRICASPGWGAAWESALAADHPRPGEDPSVISDAMILAAVQQQLTSPVAGESGP